MKSDSLKSFVGKRGLYIEAGAIAIVYVFSVTAGERGLTASIVLDTTSTNFCNLNGSGRPGKSGADWENSCPFGHNWEISEQWEFFDCQPDRWSGNQIGFQILFAPEAIQKFEQKDLSWIHAYYQ